VYAKISALFKLEEELNNFELKDEAIDALFIFVKNTYSSTCQGTMMYPLARHNISPK